MKDLRFDSHLNQIIELGELIFDIQFEIRSYDMIDLIFDLQFE